jgi:hypothetical protein
MAQQHLPVLRQDAAQQQETALVASLLLGEFLPVPAPPRATNIPMLATLTAQPQLRVLDHLLVRRLATALEEFLL